MRCPDCHSEVGRFTTAADPLPEPGKPLASGEFHTMKCPVSGRRLVPLEPPPAKPLGMNRKAWKRKKSQRVKPYAEVA